MDFLTLLVVAVALGLDAFSVAVGLGTQGANSKQALRVSLWVTVFHVFMPLLGLFLGFEVGKFLGQTAQSVGAVILLLIGIEMVWEGMKPPRQKRVTFLLSGWGGLVLAGIVSIDALAVGFGLGMLGIALGEAVVLLGVIAGVMTAGGFFCGNQLGKWFPQGATFIGGGILILIGLRLFLPVF